MIMFGKFIAAVGCWRAMSAAAEARMGMLMFWMERPVAIAERSKPLRMTSVGSMIRVFGPIIVVMVVAATAGAGIARTGELDIARA